MEKVSTFVIKYVSTHTMIQFLLRIFSANLITLHNQNKDEGQRCNSLHE